jgi:inorganic pyrophosphatase
MRIAVYANSRTAVAAQNGFQDAFITAFKAGSVMGFALVSLALLILFVVVHIWALYFSRAYKDMDTTKHMYECIAGYGLGGSAIALFGRVGGGIYTKAADVGADLCKIDYGMEEDSPDNPAVIADNVGDNVGDIAGMGADLFGSFAESTCAAMVIAAQSSDLYNNSAAIHFPLVVSAAGIFVSLITTFFATQCSRVDAKDHIEPTLKRQLLISTVLMTPVVLGLCYWLMPHSFAIGYKDTGTYKDGVLWWYPFICISLGLWSGLLIGYTTEYFTSNRYHHVQELSHACEGGNASFNIILGLALGYKSVVIPIFALALTIYVSYSLAGMYGIALAAIGILSTLCIGLTIDAYGPICDNAGGIAEMSGMEPAVRQRTDALDAAGNTTAAIGKGFAIGSAAFVSLALFGAFVTTVGLDSVDLLNPAVFAGLLVGAMLPYWFSALTMKSLGTAARAMSIEVGRQLGKKKRVQDAHHADAASDNKEGDEGAPLIAGRGPDYKACIKISTDASLKEMVAPGLLVMLTPILVGFLLGVHCLAGVLTGALVSGVQVAVSASNSGGAWDNAKKFVEGELNLKHTAQHAAAVVGDTVGDPLKDTSGPSLNILIKLMAIISLVFAPSFPGPNSGGLISQALHKMFNWY